MIWISRDIELMIPSPERVTAYADDVRLDGKTFRKLTPAMFGALRDNREAKRLYPGRFANLVAALYEMGIEDDFITSKNL